SAHLLRDFKRVGRIELVVQIGMNKKDGIVVRRRMDHGSFFCSVPDGRKHYQSTVRSSCCTPRRALNIAALRVSQPAFFETIASSRTIAPDSKARTTRCQP